MMLIAAMAALISFTPLVAAAPQAQEGAISIAFVNPHFPVRVENDARLLTADVNAERAKHGVQMLVRDPALDRFAYAKASEMAARGYFGHTDPDGITFFDRMRAWRWPTAYVAENMAFDRDEEHAQAAFMGSAPHCFNELDPGERRIGVAVVTVASGETFYVEDFSAN
jgi:uncharacterized protein YkwD